MTGLIREVLALPERQRVALTAIGLPAGIAYMAAAISFVRFAFNVIDAGTWAYLGVPIGILVASGICGLVGRWLTGRLYPGLLLAGIVALGLSLAAAGWAFLAVAASSVI